MFVQVFPSLFMMVRIYLELSEIRTCMFLRLYERTKLTFAFIRTVSYISKYTNMIEKEYQIDSNNYSIIPEFQNLIEESSLELIIYHNRVIK